MRPTLGISADDEVGRSLIGDDAGVPVLSVAAGSPAQRAGLRAWEMTPNGRIRMGDIIEAVDGRAIENFQELINVLDSHDFGDRITLTVRRDEQRVDVPITLATADASRTR